MTKKLYIDIESTVEAALLNVVDGSYSIVAKPEDELCSGYAYFKVVDGRKKLVALLAYEDKLYLYYDTLYELNAMECKVSLKEGFFKNEFKLFKNDELILAVKYKPTSYDAGVFEEINRLFQDSKYASLCINNTVKVLSETSPASRKKVDEACMQLLEKIKSGK